jgi:large subunit ribosomal protein L20
MPRAKRGFKRRRRHNKVKKAAEGFVLGRKNEFRRTSEAVDRANVYAFRDRRTKKRDFRQLWIARISAATANFDISYSRLIAAMKKSNVELDRKVLAEIAIVDLNGFGEIVNQVKAHAPAA